MAWWRTTDRPRNRRRDSALKATVRVAERRRANRRRAFAALGVLVGIPALAFGIYGGARWAWAALFSENDYFEIRTIDVTTDGTLGADHVREYAKVCEGQNLFAVRPKEIRDALLLVPVIESAQVGRRLPDTLIIEVAERVAVARLGRPGAGSPLAVDSTGHVLGPSSVRASLPVILGVRDKGLRPGDVVADPMLKEALAVLEICNQMEIREDLSVATIRLDNEEYLDLGLSTGEQVLLSRGRMREKLRKLCEMRKVTEEMGLDLTVYDMTLDRNYVGRPSAWSDPGGGAGD